MVAGPQGYEPVLEVHLDTVAVTSSLNDIRLVSAESCRVFIFPCAFTSMCANFEALRYGAICLRHSNGTVTEPGYLLFLFASLSSTSSATTSTCLRI